MEVAKLKEKIRKYCGEHRIVENENLLRDQKRQIVNNITDNIFVLRHGFKDTKEVTKISDYQQKLIRLV